MEKLICSACGAPLTPDSRQPFITCEYCDTAIENKFYVAPAQPEPAPVTETPAEEPAAEPETEVQGSSGGGSLLKTLVGVGTALAANKLRKNTRSVVSRPARSAYVPRVRQPAAQVLRRGSESITHTPPPSMPRPTGGMSGRSFGAPGGRGPSGRGPGGRGPGGRGPGGRHR